MKMQLRAQFPQLIVGVARESIMKTVPYIWNIPRSFATGSFKSFVAVLFAILFPLSVFAAQGEDAEDAPKCRRGKELVCYRYHITEDWYQKCEQPMTLKGWRSLPEAFLVRQGACPKVPVCLNEGEEDEEEVEVYLHAAEYKKYYMQGLIPKPDEAVGKACPEKEKDKKKSGKKKSGKKKKR